MVWVRLSTSVKCVSAPRSAEADARAHGCDMVPEIRGFVAVVTRHMWLGAPTSVLTLPSTHARESPLQVQAAKAVSRGGLDLEILDGKKLNTHVNCGEAATPAADVDCNEFRRHRASDACSVNFHNMHACHLSCKPWYHCSRGVVGQAARSFPRGSQEQLWKAKPGQDLLPRRTAEPASTSKKQPLVADFSRSEKLKWSSGGSVSLLPAKRARRFQVSLIAAALSVALVFFTPPAYASIAEAVSTSLRDIAPDWLVVLVLASLPVVELRGAVPVGISILGLPPPVTYVLAVMGNMIPVPLILLGLGPLVKASAGVPPLYRLLERLLSRARKQTQGMDKDTIFMGLAYFVAVPLPGTGAWSGAIAAFVLGVPFWPAVMSNFLGVCCAGALVTMLTCMGWAGLWLAILILLVLPLISFLVRSMRADPKS